MFSRRRFSRGKEINGKKKLGLIFVVIRFLLPKLFNLLTVRGVEIVCGELKIAAMSGAGIRATMGYKGGCFAGGDF
jgi:hypothetical protein